MSNRPWFKFYVSDWLLSETIEDMTPEERGIYVQLLAHQWQRGGTLRDDDAKLQRWAGADDKQWTRSKDRVLAQFERAEGLVYNCKLKALWDCKEQESKHKSAAGKHGVQVREQNRKQLVEHQPKQDGANGKQMPKAALRLASLLKQEVLRNKPDCKITSGQERVWEMVAAKMLRLDGRSEAKIAAVIRWAQHDEFWKANALSMDAIRRHFDQLEIKSGLGDGKPAPMVNPAEIVRAELEQGS